MGEPLYFWAHFFFFFPTLSLFNSARIQFSDFRPHVGGACSSFIKVAACQFFSPFFAKYDLTTSSSRAPS